MKKYILILFLFCFSGVTNFSFADGKFKCDLLNAVLVKGGVVKDMTKATWNSDNLITKFRWSDNLVTIYTADGYQTYKTAVSMPRLKMFSLEKQIVGSPFEISFHEGILQRVYNNLAEISVTHYS